MSARGMFWRVALFNIPFILLLAAVSHLPDFLKVLAAGAVVLLVPGLAWNDWRNGDAVIVLFRAIVVSLLMSLAVWLVTMLPAGPTDRLIFISLLALITNIGLVIGWRRGWYGGRPFAEPVVRALLVVAVLYFAQSYLGAAHFVPPLEDQDMETQGTAYGLIHEGSPTMVTNRASRFFFAHPLLLHFWIGESALVMNDLDRLRHYHDSSLEAAQHPDKLEALWQPGYDQFLRDPVLLANRTPNIFLGAFIILPLGLLVFRLSGSGAAAVGACLLYMTLPEVYVRTSYGGYFAITNFLLTTGAYLYCLSSGAFSTAAHVVSTSRLVVNRLAFGVAAMSGWADQKAILMAFAAPAHAGLRTLFGGELRHLFARVLARPEVLTAFLLGFGFVVGWATYAWYGYSVAPAEFIDDHIRGHIYQRVRMNDINLMEVAQGTWVYPSILALWRQFAEHSGWLFFIPAVAAVLYALPRIREPAGVLTTWVLIGAVGFSLVDWRQTKHLAHILPALTILLALFWARLPSEKVKTALTVVLGAALAWNVWRIGELMRDFEYLKPLPIW